MHRLALRPLLFDSRCRGSRSQDVQGFECRALGGMSRLLALRTIDTLHVEVSVEHLEAQGCSELGLMRLLWDAGYAISRPRGDWNAIARAPKASV